MSSTSNTSKAEASNIVSFDQEHEVFLSFRGPDTRVGFADHLYRRLIDANIRVFRDDEELRKGEKIGPELLQAINRSAIAIPIFSKRYAESKWCLNELVEILKCKKSSEMKVIPIFYFIKPSDVRNQIGDYEEAFALHEQKYGSTITREWKEAMSEIGNLSGWEIPSDTYSREGELVEDVTKKMSLELKKAYVKIPDHLVGLSHHVRKILELLSLETQGVRIIGIHGMGGIGKTTLAKVVYNHLLTKFEGSSFLADTRSKDIEDLKRNMTSDILARKSSNYVDKGTSAERFIDKRVLIVIDDVDEKTRLDDLIGKHDKHLFASRSRIIITSRNKGFSRRIQVDESYELIEMDCVHSLKLFCRHAFGSDEPKVDYVTLSMQIVKTTGRLPLALEVIGSSLHNESKEVWKSKLERLKHVPADDVMQKLRISYDELNDRQKNIFLDIACFFIGEDQRDIIHFWDLQNLFPEEAINVLQRKSLIKVHDNELWMHDQLRDVGREIVREGNIMNLEKQTRLWNQEEGTKVFMTNKGTEEIQGIRVDFNERALPYFVNEALAKLSKVRLFWARSPFSNPNPPSKAVPSSFLPENPYICFSEVRWLSWSSFPHEYIETSNFSLLNLTILNLSRSSFTIDWDGWTQIKMAKNLKVLDLSWCQKLVKTPDFLSHLQLERLILGGCSTLEEIDESIGMLKHLVHLDLSWCQKLVKTPDFSSHLQLERLILRECFALEEIDESICMLEHLVHLDLQYCRRLCKLPKELRCVESLTELLVDGCRDIVEIPQLSNMVKLEVFSASLCTSLNCCIPLTTSLEELSFGSIKISLIPDSIGELVRLVKLDLSGCSSLKSLPESIGGLVSLTYLGISESEIEELPNSIGKLENLLMLDLRRCSSLKSLPESIGGLVSLTHLDISKSEIEELPNSIGKLENLLMLDLRRCSSLKSLPESIGGLVSLTHLDISKSEIEELPNSIGKLENLLMLDLRRCSSLKSLPESIGGLVSLTHLDISKSEIEELPNSIVCLKNLMELSMSDTPIRELPSTIERLKKLEEIDAGGCGSLCGGLPMLPVSLINLTLPFEIMGTVPDLSNLINLVNFKIDREEWDLEEWASIDWAPIESPSPLWIGRLGKVENLDLAFPRMTTLHPDIGSLSQLTHLQLVGCVHLQSIPKLPSNLTSVKVDHCCMISQVDELPENLETLTISNCGNLKRLPQMSQYKKLKTLQLWDCPDLVEIHGRLESIETLSIQSCESLVKIPDILNVMTLRDLRISGCPKLIREGSILRLYDLLPVLMDNPPISEKERSFMSNMLRICSYSQNEEEKVKVKRKREWVET